MNLKSNKAIILLSGGPDSVSLAYWAKEQGYTLHGLYLDHGHKYSTYELSSAEEIANQLDMPLETVSLAGIIPVFNFRSATGGSDPDEYIPNGTAIVTSIATAFGIQYGINKCFMAIHSEDIILGPEMSRQFLDSVESNVDIVNPSESGQKSFEILTPFISKTKSDILNIGNKLNVPFEKTWSCIASENNRHCGLCAACRARQKAFKESGLNDPTHYQQTNAG